MSLPVKGLTDEELEGCASLHPEAATELAERIAKGAFAKDERLDDLESQLARSEEDREDAESRLEDLRNAGRQVLDILEKLLEDEHSPEDHEHRTKEAIRLLEGEL